MLLLTPAHQAWRDISSLALVKAGIPVTIAMVVTAVARSDRLMTQKALAVETRIDPGALVHLLDQCETEGLLVRISKAGDRHSKEIDLLPAGQHLADRIDTVLDALRCDLLDKIPMADVNTAVHVLRTLEQRALVWAGKVPT
jgi:MarR family transcriptional regulator for hemolysin